jgi:hypothetical protein
MFRFCCFFELFSSTGFFIGMGMVITVELISYPPGDGPAALAPQSRGTPFQQQAADKHTGVGFA